jgi:hypothetical protein
MDAPQPRTLALDNDEMTPEEAVEYFDGCASSFYKFCRAEGVKILAGGRFSREQILIARRAEAVRKATK